MTKEEIKIAVAAEHLEDNVLPSEVVLRENGEIVIDRTATYPWATPVIVGRWS